MPVLPSYRNQSTGLLCKSIDWFLYEGNKSAEWVKEYRVQVKVLAHADDFLAAGRLEDLGIW